MVVVVVVPVVVLLAVAEVSIPNFKGSKDQSIYRLDKIISL